MKAASPLLSAGFMMVCLLGAARLSSDEIGSRCPCPVIPPWPETRTPPEECRQINSAFRYSCVEGKVRKAGTSNRIKCELKDGNVQWEESKLECIDDPRRPKPPTTTKSTIQTSSTSLHMNQSTVAQDGKGRNNTDEKLHDVVTPTSVQTWEVETSTFSLGVASNQTSEALGAGSQMAIISCASLVVVFAVIGIVCVWYRRRSRNKMSTQLTEEELPMRPPGELPT